MLAIDVKDGIDINHHLAWGKEMIKTVAHI